MQYEYGKSLADDAIVTSFEGQFELQLPRAYRALVMQHDGATLRDSSCIFTNPQTGLREAVSCNALIPFAAIDEGDRTMDAANGGLIDGLPENCIVFGENAGAPLFCFDYRESPETNDPPVVLFYPENDDQHAIIRVGDDFETFIASLVEDPGVYPVP